MEEFLVRRGQVGGKLGVRRPRIFLHRSWNFIASTTLTPKTERPPRYCSGLIDTTTEEKLKRGRGRERGGEDKRERRERERKEQEERGVAGRRERGKERKLHRSFSALTREAI